MYDDWMMAYKIYFNAMFKVQEDKKEAEKEVEDTAKYYGNHQEKSKSNKEWMKAESEAYDDAFAYSSRMYGFGQKARATQFKSSILKGKEKYILTHWRLMCYPYRGIEFGSSYYCVNCKKIHETNTNTNCQFHLKIPIETIEFEII